MCNKRCNKRGLGRTCLDESTTGTAPTLVNGMQRVVKVADGLEVWLKHSESPRRPSMASMMPCGASTCPRPRIPRHEASTRSEKGYSMLSMCASRLETQRARAANLITFSPWPYRAAWQGRREAHSRHSQKAPERTHTRRVRVSRVRMCMRSGRNNNGCVLQAMCEWQAPCYKSHTAASPREALL